MNPYPIFPERASTFADKTDPMFYVLSLLTVVFTVIVLSFLLFLTIRYRAGNKNVNRSGRHHHSIVLELTWSIIPLIIGLVMFLWTAWPYASIYHAPKDAIQIYVIGKRWMWHLQHANGVRENNELHIPVNKPINMNLISQDVIHGFYVPAFRIKRDALPGKYNQMWFQATKTGRYHFFCTEYCGTNHSEMTGWVTVMEPHDYELWLASAGARVVAQKQTMEQLGETLYTQLACGNCHDMTGIGRGPSLVGLYGSKVLKNDGTSVIADDNYLRNSIINPSDDVAAGYQQVMPSYKDQLTEEQLLELLSYIKSLRVPEPITTTTAATGTVEPGQPGTGVVKKPSPSIQKGVPTGVQPPLKSTPTTVAPVQPPTAGGPATVAPTEAPTGNTGSKM